MNEYTRETVKALPTFYIVVVMVFSVSIFAAFARPYFMDLRREAIQHSNEYVESKATLLLGLVEDWHELETEIVETSSAAVVSAKRAQQAAVAARINSEVDRLPESEVPPSVLTFISQAGSN